MLASQDQSSEFRTPVRRLAATVTFRSGAVLDVVLFCQPGENVGRLLTASDPFLPVEQGGKIRLVARETLAVVTTPLGENFDEEEETLTRRVSMTVRLSSGKEVEGEVAFTPRPGRPRVLDFLNEPDATLRLVGAHEVHHVSKRQIDSVEER
jgi:hypothetical protein